MDFTQSFFSHAMTSFMFDGECDYSAVVVGERYFTFKVNRRYLYDCTEMLQERFFIKSYIKAYKNGNLVKVVDALIDLPSYINMEDYDVRLIFKPC
mgnify:CR=1 FL=1